MKRTFKERAVFLAARIIRKSKIFIPVVYPFLGIVLLIDALVKTIYANGKKEIAVCVLLLFFFMSSSFTRPESGVESETYLNASQDNSVISSLDMDLGDTEEVSINNISKDEADEIIFFDDLIEENELNTIEAFTLSDFYEGLSLSEGNSLPEELAGFDKEAWNLILVNKTNPLPKNYEINLATIKGSMQCDERVLEPLVDMLNGAAKEGIELVVCSPYREDKLQEKLFLRKINAYMAKGYSYLDAYKISSQDVIVPGTSEHQLGLAFDIVVPYHMVLDFDFGKTAGGIWLKENCAKYGFILRYPKGKETITGIEYEPWHFRYVGPLAAEYIMENDLTLEEFTESL